MKWKKSVLGQSIQNDPLSLKVIIVCENMCTEDLEPRTEFPVVVTVSGQISVYEKTSCCFQSTRRELRPSLSQTPGQAGGRDGPQVAGSAREKHIISSEKRLLFSSQYMRLMSSS